MAAVTKPDLAGFWVHLDVDVLDDALMPAVDYRHPGGITWEEALMLLGGLLTSDRARGVEVTIFNPQLDLDGSIAQRLSDLIADSVLRGPCSRTVPRLPVETSRPERRSRARRYRLQAAAGLPHSARCEQVVSAGLPVKIRRFQRRATWGASPVPVQQPRASAAGDRDCGHREENALTRGRLLRRPVGGPGRLSADGWHGA
jgi:Arginase family